MARAPERPDFGGPFPAHIAVIMDGNGRWAQKQGFKRVFGHEKGVAAVRAIVTECAQLGVESLTLYAFSVENWKRPEHEIRFLMGMLERFLVDERPTLMENRNAIGVIKHHVNVVFGEQDPDSPLTRQPSQDLDDNRTLAHTHPGRRLIEQQHLGLAGERNGEFESLPVARSELGGWPLDHLGDPNRLK